MSPVLYPSDLSDAKWALLLPLLPHANGSTMTWRRGIPESNAKDSLFWVHFAER